MPKKEKTLFQKILDRELPAEFVFEDELCFAIKDIYPKAPVHFLIIPRKPIESLENITEEDAPLLTHLLLVARNLAGQHKCEGYRIQINVGEKGGQVIFHLHVHMMGWL
ncbi:MAG: histidine triad nucleotide-binding protein [Candidatus Gracilibacteria bacterium]|jgi:histidine triad (HIT) family protein